MFINRISHNSKNKYEEKYIIIIIITHVPLRVKRVTIGHRHI